MLLNFLFNIFNSFGFVCFLFVFISFCVKYVTFYFESIGY
ncbi:MAG: hypothetical protein K0R59_1105 [Sphingobacterium sp.]|jgi:hypothetical protein|nr:hypothetical protein [Sphingobacterium sp.]